jgi:hypothetical protein
MRPKGLHSKGRSKPEQVYGFGRNPQGVSRGNITQVTTLRERRRCFQVRRLDDRPGALEDRAPLRNDIDMRDLVRRLQVADERLLEMLVCSER